VPARSAGLLLHRTRNGTREVLLVHPGGPFWASRDAGAWSIPKGEVEAGEEPRDTARREFEEELGLPAPPAAALEPLGEVRQRAGKVVEAWAAEHDLDPEGTVPGTFELEWPPRSGRRASFPEVDRAAWFGLAEARMKLNPAQVALLDALA